MYSNLNELLEIRYNLDEVEYVAQEVIENVKSKTILFYGNMGVGKTTLIKAIVKLLGSADEVSSPTFSIVNEYRKETEHIYHFDLYRVQNIEEAYDLGIEDYLNTEFWKLIEWPEKIEDILFDNFEKIYLEMDVNNKRILTIKNI